MYFRKHQSVLIEDKLATFITMYKEKAICEVKQNNNGARKLVRMSLNKVQPANGLDLKQGNTVTVLDEADMTYHEGTFIAEHEGEFIVKVWDGFHNFEKRLVTKGKRNPETKALMEQAVEDIRARNNGCFSSEMRDACKMLIDANWEPSDGT